MPSLRHLRRSIRSVKNTQKITKAMKMVAAAKLRRAQEAVMQTRPYADQIATVVEALSATSAAAANPFLREIEVPARADVLIISSDKGLCGSFNANIFKRGAALIREELKGKQVSLTILGRKAAESFERRNYSVRKSDRKLMSKFGYEDAVGVAKELSERFLAGDTDEVYVVYMEFRSVVSQRVMVRKLLPFPQSQQTEDAVDYLFEPSVAEVLESLLPRCLSVNIYRMMLESAASEFGARMTAMDSATKNAGEMLQRLTLKMNRARQAAITKELIEIVSGADALQG